jgi:monovalent cation:H+ antiporter-2, CPA2 family
VAAAILSITLNPLTYRFIPRIEKQIQRLAPGFARWVDRRAAGDGLSRTPVPVSSGTHRAIVVGYGPVGQTVARLLRENEIEPTIVELNVETVQQLTAEGISAIYGDVSRPETLNQAGLATATALVLSASSIQDGREIIRHARELNPKIRVLARTAYLRELDELRAAGADAVFSGEGEVALAMTESVLTGLGATPEQIDRERQRVHDTLFGALDAPRIRAKIR